MSISKNSPNKPCQNPRLGSDFDEFLRETGLEAEVHAAAAKKAYALRLAQIMARRRLTKSALAGLLGTSRAALDRVLDGENTSVTLHTLSKTAAAVGCKLNLEFVSAPMRAK